MGLNIISSFEKLNENILEKNNNLIHLKDVLKKISSIWVYNNVKNAHFTSEYPIRIDEDAEVEDYPLEDLLDMSNENLLNVPLDILHSQTDLELLDRIAHLDKSKLTYTQLNRLKQKYSQKIILDENDIVYLLDKIKKCQKLVIAERPENKNLLNYLDVEDCLNILKHLNVEDYAYSTKSYNLAHFGNQLIIFKPRNVVVRDKNFGPLTLYIKIDLDESTEEATIALSFHINS